MGCLMEMNMETFEGRSPVEFMWVEFGTEVGPCDGRATGRDVGKLEE